MESDWIKNRPIEKCKIKNDDKLRAWITNTWTKVASHIGVCFPPFNKIKTLPYYCATKTAIIVNIVYIGGSKRNPFRSLDPFHALCSRSCNGLTNKEIWIWFKIQKKYNRLSYKTNKWHIRQLCLNKGIRIARKAHA